MPTNLVAASFSAELAVKALRDEPLSRAEARQVLETPEAELEALLEATLEVRTAHFGRRVKLCVLLNAQSGICPEDCGYCSQSKVSTAPTEKYRLLPEEVMWERAQQAAGAGARRFCMVMAARGPQDRDVAHLANAVRRIKAEPATQHLEVCTSLGLMNEAQCRALKEAGVDYVNHNLNTSAAHYPNICKSHSYADRLATLSAVEAAGLKMCSGGIVGMGETLDDIVDLAFALRELQVESIPINFLLAIPGTPLAGTPPLEPLLGLKTLCLMRLLNPRSEVRMAAGRERQPSLRQAQALCAANSLFVNGYLTTPGDPAAEVKDWIVACGFEVETAAHVETAASAAGAEALA